MLEDYCSKLQQINKEKNEFLKLKYKSNAKNAIDKQENKYHKYILSQISHKNKIDALLQLTQSFNNIIHKHQRPAFDLIFKIDNTINSKVNLSHSNIITQKLSPTN